MKHVLLTSLIIIISTNLFSQSLNIYHKGWIDFNKNGKKDIYEDSQQPIEKRIEDLLSQMTMDEKTCQMVTLYGYGRVAKDELPTKEWKNKLWKDGLGNIDEASNGVFKDAKYKFPYDKHVKGLNIIQSFFVEKTRLGIPVEFTNEGIRGLNHYRSTSFPAQIAMGCTWNVPLVSRMAEVVGKEAYALGYNNIYSPVLDISRDQRWGRNVECLGEDPYLVGEYGLAIVKGIQSQGVISTLKHFAMYSAPKGGRDGHVRLDPHITLRELHNIYLYPFRKAIIEGKAKGVMSSYNDYDGVPVTGSYYFLTELLRNKYGFTGYVVSDSGAVLQIYSKHNVADSFKDAVRQSVEAGLNIRTNFKTPKTFVVPLRELIKEGKLSEKIINNRVRDILRVKFIEKLFDQPYKNEKEVNNIVRNAEHLKLSKQTSLESIVLLKNKDNILPLDENKFKNILIVGPNAKAEKSSHSRYGSLGIDVVSGYEGINNMLKNKANIQYAKGCKIYSDTWPADEVLDYEPTQEDKELLNEAIRKAKTSDVIIAFVGEDETMVGESLSRTSLNLPETQRNMLREIYKLNKPVIVVLINGRPLSINNAQQKANAIIEAWFPGEFGGEAIADVIFGKYNPAGRLNCTWPRTVGQIPMNFPAKPYSQTGQHKKGNNGIGNSRINNPLYYFGYGLSYTKFEYLNLKIINTLHENNQLKVCFDIKNIGDKDGEEVPQLYIHDKVSSVTVYEWQLKGFQRVKIKAGETKHICMKINTEDLSLLNRNMERVTETGEFVIAIGSSSNNIHLKDSFKY